MPHARTPYLSIFTILKGLDVGHLVINGNTYRDFFLVLSIIIKLLSQIYLVRDLLKERVVTYCDWVSIMGLRTTDLGFYRTEPIPILEEKKLLMPTDSADTTNTYRYLPILADDTISNIVKYW